MSKEIISSAEAAIPATGGLNADARDYARASKADNTKRAYSAQLRQWEEYSRKQGVPPYPATPATVANWLAGRARSGQAYATLRTAIAAVRAGHLAHGLAFDSRAPEIAAVMSGISRVHARAQGQVEPIRGADVIDMLASLGTLPIDLRDGALLATAYLFALRRSELVGLDFDSHGSGDGHIRITARTVEMVLARSKTSTAGDVEQVTVPRAPVASAVDAIERWVSAAGIMPGEPLLRRVGKGGTIGRAVASDGSEDASGGRLHPQSIALIIKVRVAEYLERQGVPRDKARAEAAQFSGHSLRVGFAVTAAEAGASADEIALVTRHRSLEMPRRYSAKADAVRRSPFRRPGVGTDPVGLQ